MEYRFDGLRFDAVHAIEEQDWVDEMAATVRATVEPGRHVHLVLEHHNDASHLEKDCDAQWNDDGHNVLHVLLTGEDGGYYADYADRPAEKLARCLAEGFIFQGEHSDYLGAPRGMPSGHLPPTAFVLFLQNHDQIGNRAFGERLTTLADPAALEAAIALAIAVSANSAAVHGRGDCEPHAVPVLYRSSGRTGRCGARGHGGTNSLAFRHSPIRRSASTSRIPNARERSRPPSRMAIRRGRHRAQALYRRLIALRRTEIVPRLDATRCSIEARADRRRRPSLRAGDLVTVLC